MSNIELDCPEWTVPGWLDENGLPTSCVGDHPCPGMDAPACAPASEAVPTVGVPASPPLTELPYTGPVDALLAPLGAVLLVAGAVLLLIRRRVTAIG